MLRFVFLSAVVSLVFVSGVSADKGRRTSGPDCIALTAARYGKALPKSVIAGTRRSVGVATPCKPWERRAAGIPIPRASASGGVVSLGCIQDGQVVLCPDGFGVGLNGRDGAPGAPGPAGPAGAAGSTGPAGPQGAPGASCHVSKDKAGSGHVSVSITCPDGSTVTFREDTD